MSSSMAQRLKGKTIVITGASSGIGKSTAVEFARTQPDIKLILTARREDTLKEVAKEIESLATGVKVLPVKLDVSKVEEVQAFVGNLPAEFKDIDVLVNNACVSILTFSLGAGPLTCNATTVASSKASPKPPPSPPPTSTPCSPQTWPASLP
jgi:NADP-dependent 3-hydroxy acid dehydrogenase YdfG